mgnify:FL=1
MGNWQKCPLCNGTGKDVVTKINETSSVCSVCNGKKIISTLNGNPPK